MMEFLKWWGSLSTGFTFGVGVLMLIGFLGIVHLIETVVKAIARKRS